MEKQWDPDQPDRETVLAYASHIRERFDAGVTDQIEIFFAVAAQYEICFDPSAFQRAWQLLLSETPSGGRATG